MRWTSAGCGWANPPSSAIPMGNGEKVRGKRATHLLIDEFASTELSIIENVVLGFAAVSASPLDKVKRRPTRSTFRRRACGCRRWKRRGGNSPRTRPSSPARPCGPSTSFSTTSRSGGSSSTAGGTRRSTGGSSASPCPRTLTTGITVSSASRPHSSRPGSWTRRPCRGPRRPCRGPTSCSSTGALRVRLGRVLQKVPR
jgi:hypothetical protein